MSLARLVLNKYNLTGLRVVLQDDATEHLVEACIQQYDEEQDCFILINTITAMQYAVQFHQFTVEEEQRQLVLKVSNCTHVALPNSSTAATCDPGTAVEAGRKVDDGNTAHTTGQEGKRGSDSCAQDAASTHLSAQLATELSQQLSGLVGRSFSHTDEGFETLVAAGSPTLQVQTIAAEAATDRSDKGEEDEEGLYWGSPVKHETAPAEAAAAAIGSAADMRHEADGHPQLLHSYAVIQNTAQSSTVQPAKEAPAIARDALPASARAAAAATPSAEVSATEGAASSCDPSGDPQADSVGNEAASFCRRASRLSSSSSASYDMQHTLEAALRTPPIAVPAACSTDASFTSFKQISRMISNHEDANGSPMVGRTNSKSGHGLAARLLESGGTWGTPREESLWGTPREQHSEHQQHSTADSGSPEDRNFRMTSGNRRGRDASSTCMPLQTMSGSAHQQLQQHVQQEDTSACIGSASAAAGESAGAAAPDCDDLDFTIAADVQPLPAVWASRRSSRGLYRIPSSDATDAGMMVDIPQPLSSRRVSRTSMRAVYTPSDPGFAYVQPGTNSSGGGAAIAAAELRRVTSTGVSARRISRNTSSRLNADQDWGIIGPDGQLQSIGGGGGAALHVPAASSRRTSRTLSGRLPPDQDGAAAAAMQLAQLGDAEPDVLSRPPITTSTALDTILSRGQSTNGRPGTPDSDGFGFSEFEGIEPLVPPELAQQDAIAEEAVIHAAADELAATAIAATSHHRHPRRSAHNISAAVAAPTHRVSVRLSDQDERGPSPLLSPTGFEASSSARQQQHLHSLSGGQLADQAIETARADDNSAGAHQMSLSSAGVQGQTTRNSSSLEAVTEDSPAVEGITDDAAASEPASEDDSRRTSKSRSRSMSGILQAAAAIAAAAEGAVAAAVGFALGGKGTAEQQQSMQEAMLATGSAETDTLQQLHGQAKVADPQPEAADPSSRLVSFANLGAFAAGAADLKDKVLTELKDKVPPDGCVIQSVDSFSCPPFIPVHVGSTSAKSSLNPFANGSSGSFSFMSGQLQAHSSSNLAAFHIGTAVAADPADVLQQQQLQASFPSPGSPTAAAAALLRKQLLPPASIDGSEWGSGAMLGSHINSAVESPIGSAVFKSNPFDTSSDYGSLPAGELTAALDGLSTVKAAFGASRMGREAAIAASTLPFDDWSSAMPPGVSIHEITPADSDTESEKICSYKGDEAADFYHRSRLAVGNSQATAVDSSTATQQPGLALDKEQLGLGNATPDGNIIPSTRSSLLGFAAANAQAAAATAGGLVDGIKLSTGHSSSDGSAWPLPPTYSESVGGAEADDECSTPDHLASRRVWPARYAAGVTAAETCSSDSGDSTAGLIRHEAELTAGPSSRVSKADESTTAALQTSGSTGLKRRSRPVSRAPSQSLPPSSGANGVVYPVDGMVTLPGTNYNYADEDHQPLVQHHKGVVSYAAGQVTSTLDEARAQIGRVILHTCLGVSAQWFDLIALVILGGQLTAAMMAPGLALHQQLGRLFEIFAAGHVLWLVGCFVWPWLTNHIGRKAVLAWTVGLSVFPTALLGCMPAYSEGGTAGIVIIAILRFLAGLSLSNDAPAAIAYLTEHAPQLPSLHASLIPCSMAVGALGAAVAGLFVAWLLSPVSLAVFGWRLPLVATLVANCISGGLRVYVLQDPEVHMRATDIADRRNGHVWRVIRYHPLPIANALALQAFAACGLYLMAAWLPVYFVQLTGLKASLAMTIHAVNMAVLAGTIPLGGFLADKYGSTSMLLATCAAAALFAYPAWLLFSLAEAGVSWFGQFVLVTLVGLHWGVLPAVLVERFPKGVRSSAMTLSFVLAMVSLGCLSPLIALGFITRTHSLASPAVLMIISAVVTGGTVLVTNQPARDY